MLNISQYVEQYASELAQLSPTIEPFDNDWTPQALTTLLGQVAHPQSLCIWLQTVDLQPCALAAIVNEAQDSDGLSDLAHLPILTDLGLIDSRAYNNLYPARWSKRPEYLPTSLAKSIAMALDMQLDRAIDAQSLHGPGFAPDSCSMISCQSLITLVINHRFIAFLTNSGHQSMTSEDDWCDFYPSELGYHMAVIDWWTNKSDYRSI